MKNTTEKVDLPKLLPVIVAILDRSGTIVGVNDAWKEFARQSGLRIAGFGVGANYLQYCSTSDSPRLSDDLKSLLAGKVDLVTRIYPCHSPTTARWFYMIALPLASYDRSGVAVLHVDLTPFLPVTHVPRQAELVVGDMSISESMAGSVEYSSLEALSSQLASMLTVQALPAQQRDRDYRQEDAGGLTRVSLSKRQLEILGLLARGKTNTEIARTLCRSPNTIKLHVSAILRQLNVKSRTQAALLASKIFATERDKRKRCNQKIPLRRLTV
jgi:DNA-binding CsgD family transcriptional regulator